MYTHGYFYGMHYCCKVCITEKLVIQRKLVGGLPVSDFIGPLCNFFDLPVRLQLLKNLICLIAHAQNASVTDFYEPN